MFVPPRRRTCTHASVRRLPARVGRRTDRRRSFEVARSEIVALLGPNGAGKTTTLRMLAGLIAPTSGTIVHRRRPADARDRLRAAAAASDFVTEVPGLWDRLTVCENLRVYAGLYGVDRPDAAIDRLLDARLCPARAIGRAGR